MDALIIFSGDNAHPLRFILNKNHRHVWCAIRSGDFWVVYNWHHGVPLINVVDGQLDLTAHYQAEGCEVIETTVGDEPCHGPWMCNNCVGHTMVICGIRTHHIYTPHHLWKHLTGTTMFDNIKNFFRRCEFVPGFGGTDPVSPPTPEVLRGARRSQTPISAKESKSAGKAATQKSAGPASASSTPLSEEPGDDRGFDVEGEDSLKKKKKKKLGTGTLLDEEPGNPDAGGGGVLTTTTPRRRNRVFDFRV
jgi:hypothetical protein